jgi:cell pole-organizing protein PopZ
MRAGPSVPLARREGSPSEDNAEFELPAIFKPGHNAPVEKPANLFGRLSDALKPAAATEPDRSRTVIRFEPAGGRMIEPPPARAAPQMSRPGPQSDPAEAVAQENSTVKRIMPSFFDQRLNKLGEMTRQANTAKPVEQPKPAVPLQQLVPQPPPLRQQASGEAGGAMEDAAAQLLRPILKQWLTENMPKIVEKALRSEAGEDFPPSGMPGGRKPGQ